VTVSETTTATVIRSKDDVVDIINNSPKSPHRMRIVGFIALGGFFVDAYDFTSLSAGAARLQADFGLTAEQLGLATAVTALGALVGGLAGGYFVDRFGRMRMFILNLILFVLATLGAALSPNLEVLVVFRFLIGFGVGLDVPVALAFLVEFMAMKNKGKWTESAAALWAGAAIFGLLLALLFDTLGFGDNLWRLLIGFGAVPALIILLLRFKYMAESPMWLATQGDLDGAAKVLSKMYRQSYVAGEPTVAASAGAHQGFLRKFAVLFSRPFRARSILIAILSGMQAVQQNSVNFYMPIIVVALFHASYQTSLLTSVGTNACGLVAALIAAYTADRLGLRRITIIGLCATTLILLILGFTGAAMPAIIAVALLALFTGFHNFGPGSTAQAMSVMSYPTQIRGLGGGLSQASNRTFSLIILYSSPILLSTLGLYTTLLILAIAPIIGLIALAFIRYEPIGKAPDLDPTAEAIR
jgi:MFS transporter, putative metabolite transport protein